MEQLRARHVLISTAIVAAVLSFATPAFAASFDASPPLAIGGTKTIAGVIVLVVLIAGGAIFWFTRRNK